MTPLDVTTAIYAAGLALLVMRPSLVLTAESKHVTGFTPAGLIGVTMTLPALALMVIMAASGHLDGGLLNATIGVTVVLVCMAIGLSGSTVDGRGGWLLRPIVKLFGLSFPCLVVFQTFQPLLS